MIMHGLLRRPCAFAMPRIAQRQAPSVSRALATMQLEEPHVSGTRRAGLILAVAGTTLVGSYIKNLYDTDMAVREKESRLREEWRRMAEREQQAMNHEILFRESSRRARLMYVFKTYIAEPIMTIQRFSLLLLYFLPVLLTSPVLLLEYIEPPSVGERFVAREHVTTVWWYKLLVTQMRHAGATFIKLGQWAAMRRDIFPAALCDLFAEMHSHVKAHAMIFTRMEILRTLGMPIEDAFEEFDETPLGVGAIAQVYKAKLSQSIIDGTSAAPTSKRGHFLRDTIVASLNYVAGNINTLGRAILPQDKNLEIIHELQDGELDLTQYVAVKVLHPNVEKNIRRDLRVISTIGNLINRIPGMSWLSIPEEIAEFGNLMLSQVDFRVEAQNMNKFIANFAHRGSVKFPRPLVALSSKQVLIQELVDGVPLEYFMNNTHSTSVDARIAQIGLDAFMTMLIVDNFCHADLHPGNIMVTFVPHRARSFLTDFWLGKGHEFDELAAKISSSSSGVRGAVDDVSLTIDKDVLESNTDDLQNEVAHKGSSKMISDLKAIHNEGDVHRWHRAIQSVVDLGYEPNLVLIDSGLVVSLNRQNWRNFIDLFTAFAEGDGYAIGKLMIDRSVSPESALEPESFARNIKAMIDNIKDASYSLRNVQLGSLLMSLMDGLRVHHVKVEAEFINTFVAMFLVEGIGRHLDENIDIIQGAAPVLRHMLTHFEARDILTHASSSEIRNLVHVWLYLQVQYIKNVAATDLDWLMRYDQLTSNA